MTDPDQNPASAVRINGVPRAWKPAWTLETLLIELEATGPGVAVEWNRSVVRRAEYPACVLEPGDEVEVVRLVGGG
ncbi:MAG: sulfur carrier protein ThiS [Planctomycetota bacterium]